MYKDLKIVKDECIKNIVKNSVANCILTKNNVTEIKEIRPGILIFKNVFENFTSDCNKTNQYLNKMHTFILRFENCKIKITNKTYYYNKSTFKENLIETITENKSFADLNIEDIYLKQIEYEEDFRDLNLSHKKNKIVNYNYNYINIIHNIIHCSNITKKKGTSFSSFVGASI